MIESWLKEAGEDVNYTIIFKGAPVMNTKLDENNIFWVAFRKATGELGIEYVPRISQGASDIRFLRQVSFYY